MQTLLVEDDPAQLRLLEILLKKRGCIVSACSDAETAWREYQRRRHSLVVADWMLPGMTGLELCRVIKTDVDGADAVLIVVTARTTRADLQLVLEAGADDYLAKPIDPAQLDVRMSIAEHRVREVARRKVAEAALRLEQERLDALMNHIPDSIYFKDVRGAYLRVNRAASQKLGLSDPTEAVGKSDEDFYAAEYARTIRAEEMELMASHRPIVAREDLEVWPDGKTTWASTTKMPLLDRSDAVVGTFGVSRDITELKRQQQERRLLEQRVLQAQKFESLAVLAGGVAHDFNNLLTGILGNASLAAMDLPQQRTAAHASIAAIEAAAHRAAELTRQMLAFSGKGRFVVQKFQLDQLVRDTIQLLVSVVPKQISLHFEAQSSQPFIEADASQVRQALTNLVMNAVEAVSSDAGAIKIRVYSMHARREDLDSAPAGDALPEGLYAALEVADQGVGMDEPTMSKIFDPFFSTKFIGRGLGLAATLGIARGHRGTIRVQSSPGAGSIFTLLIPSLELSRPTGAESTPSSGDVVLVDQEPAVVDTLRRVLEPQQRRCIAAGSTSEASAILHASGARECALVIDVADLREESLSAIRPLLQSRPALKIVWTGELPEPIVREQIPREFPFRYLPRPFDPAALLSALR